MSTYVMSDLHGNHERYMEMLRKIKFTEDDTLYILGDVVDRGKKAFDIIEHIMSSPNIHMLMGNHEAYLIDRIRSFGYNGNPYDNGMSHDSIRRMKRIHPKKRFEILMFLKSLPYYYDIVINGKRVVLVHAGLNHEDPAKCDKDFMLWSRDEFLFEGPDFPYLIVHGHTTVQFVVDMSHNKVLHYRNRVNIDCGAPFEEGVLACLRLEDFEEFYVS